MTEIRSTLQRRSYMTKKRNALQMITMSLLLIFLLGFQSNATSIVTPRTILHYLSTGSTPSGVITATISISVQDTTNQIIGVQKMDSFYRLEGVTDIIFTPITIARDGSNAFVGVSYRYKGKNCSEAIIFYP